VIQFEQWGGKCSGEARGVRVCKRLATLVSSNLTESRTGIEKQVKSRTDGVVELTIHFCVKGPELLLTRQILEF
jgi:hypothetical protein